MAAQLDARDAIDLIENGLARLEVMKVLLCSGGPTYINLGDKQMLEGLHSIFDSICDDIGDAHERLQKVVAHVS